MYTQSSYNHQSIAFRVQDQVFTAMHTGQNK